MLATGEGLAPADSILEAMYSISARITSGKSCVGDDILGVPLYQYLNIPIKKGTPHGVPNFFC